MSGRQLHRNHHPDPRRRFDEILAQLLLRRVRRFMGFGINEDLAVEDLMRERYGGIRPAAGYPACPNTSKRSVWDLLDVEVKVGMHEETDSGIAEHGRKRYIKSPTTDSPILPP